MSQRIFGALKNGLLLILLMFFSEVNAQDAFCTIGYQYAYFGNSLSSNQIQMAGDNMMVPAGGNRYTNYQHGHGLVARLTLPASKGFQLELTIANKKVISDQTYNNYNADSSAFTSIDVKTKTRVRALSFGVSFPVKNFSFGGSMDLGVFASLRRYSGIEGESNKKWQPWFSTQKVFGSGITAKTPVVGFTVFASYRIAELLQIRIYKQFTGFGMGAELSGRYFSIANTGVELGFTFPKSK